MTKHSKPKILLTNDDGFESPGLWHAAHALKAVGDVWVVAPRDQSTGMGRSMPGSSDGIIETRSVEWQGKMWTAYAVGGSPAQVVGHAMLEVMAGKPDLVVSGINYGENLGTGVTISGTVGAALEGAANGVPGLAVSLETPAHTHTQHDDSIDFSAAAYFTAKFARLMLAHVFPADVDVLKVDLPEEATPQTSWQLTHLSRQRYYVSTKPQRADWSQPARVGYKRAENLDAFPPKSDVYTVLVRREISVTPLSLDMTSRIDLSMLETEIRAIR